MTHTKDEAFALALEALIHKTGMNPVMQGICYVMHPEALKAVIDEAIKQARSAPVQEPVALTVDERKTILNNSLTPACVVIATEAKIREKNT